MHHGHITGTSEFFEPCSPVQRISSLREVRKKLGRVLSFDESLSPPSGRASVKSRILPFGYRGVFRRSRQSNPLRISPNLVRNGTDSDGISQHSCSSPHNPQNTYVKSPHQNNSVTALFEKAETYVRKGFLVDASGSCRKDPKATIESVEETGFPSFSCEPDQRDYNVGSSSEPHGQDHDISARLNALSTTTNQDGHYLLSLDDDTVANEMGQRHSDILKSVDPGGDDWKPGRRFAEIVADRAASPSKGEPSQPYGPVEDVTSLSIERGYDQNLGAFKVNSSETDSHVEDYRFQSTDCFEAHGSHDGTRERYSLSRLSADSPISPEFATCDDERTSQFLQTEESKESRRDSAEIELCDAEGLHKEYLFADISRSVSYGHDDSSSPSNSNKISNDPPSRASVDDSRCTKQENPDCKQKKLAQPPDNHRFTPQRQDQPMVRSPQSFAMCSKQFDASNDGPNRGLWKSVEIESCESKGMHKEYPFTDVSRSVSYGHDDSSSPSNSNKIANDPSEHEAGRGSTGMQATWWISEVVAHPGKITLMLVFIFRGFWKFISWTVEGSSCEMRLQNMASSLEKSKMELTGAADLLAKCQMHTDSLSISRQTTVTSVVGTFLIVVALIFVGRFTAFKEACSDNGKAQTEAAFHASDSLQKSLTDCPRCDFWKGHVDRLLQEIDRLKECLQHRHNDSDLSSDSKIQQLRLLLAQADATIAGQMDAIADLGAKYCILIENLDENSRCLSEYNHYSDVGWSESNTTEDSEARERRISHITKRFTTRRIPVSKAPSDLSPEVAAV